MEIQNIAFELKESESKQTSLCKLYQELNSQASSMVFLSLQWEDLENRFDSIRKSLQTRLETLTEREKVVVAREKELVAIESRFESAFDSKTERLEKIERLIKERSNEAELAHRHVDSLKSLIIENEEELVEKRRDFEAIKKLTAEKGCEFDRLKGCLEEEEKRFELVRSCLKEGEGKLLSLEAKIKQKCNESELRENKSKLIRKLARMYKDDAELEERKFNAVWRNAEERKKELELREEQFRVCQKSIAEFDERIKLKEGELSAIQSLIALSNSELESKEKQLEILRRDFELKEKNFVSLKNSMDQCAQVFEKREKKLQGFLKEFELIDKLCESKILEVNLIQNKVNDCHKEVEFREKNVETLRKSMEKHSSELQAQEVQFRKRVLDFESKRNKQSDSLWKPTETRGPEPTTVSFPRPQVKKEQLEHAQINSVTVPSSTSNQDSIAKEGIDLQMLLNRHLKTHDSVCCELFTILKASKNPAKLVLEAMEGFYPSPNSNGESSEFNVTVVRRSCILLLEQLMTVSPQLCPQVVGEAKKLALYWKAKMKETHPTYLEALGILQFLAAYKLSSEFDPSELNVLIGIVDHHRQSSDAPQKLSTENKGPDIPTTEQAAEYSLASIMMSPANIQSKTNIIKILRMSSDPTQYALEYIQGTFFQPRKTGDSGVNANVLSNCIILFDQLSNISPPIQPLVREDALRVAMAWKAIIAVNSEKALDILVFLQFLDTYGLVSSFEKDEILKFLKIMLHDDEVLKICLQIGFAKKMPEFVRHLIQRKKLVDAVRLICAFKLADKFEPVTLLTEYMEDLKEYNMKNCKRVKRPIEEKEKIGDEEIVSLEALRECVMEYKLQLSHFPLGLISKRIKELENVKIQRRKQSLQVQHPRAGAEEQHHHGEHQPPNQQRKKRGRSGFHPQQGNNKFPRSASHGHRSVGPPGFARIDSSQPNLMLETGFPVPPHLSGDPWRSY